MPADLDSLFDDDEFELDDSLEGQENEIEASQDDGFEDMFRQQSARTESSLDDMQFDDSDDEFLEDSGSRGGFSLANFSPLQRLILIFLILLDILAIGFGVLVIMGLV